MKSLSLNNNRIEALVEQLYDINKRLIALEGRLLRLAESYGVARDEFLKDYQGSELDPNWMLRVSKLGGRGLERLRRQRARTTSTTCASEIHDLATETGLEIERVPPHRP